jgi:hypothetical protein
VNTAPQTTRRGATLRRTIAAAMLAAFPPATGCSPFQPAGEGRFVPEAGDLLFQDLDGSPFCDAVEKVTRGCRGADITHVGIVARDARGGLVVLEALPGEGVIATPLNAFLDRSRDGNGNPKVLVGRLGRRHRHLVPAAIAAAEALRGKPYDMVFALGNDAFYCAELVHVCFRNAAGVPLFEPQPMTFADPGTGETFPVWQEYFAQLGVPVPEGGPGLNPGAISRSPLLHIVHAYGLPAGYDGGKRMQAGDPPAPRDDGTVPRAATPP